MHELVKGGTSGWGRGVANQQEDKMRRALESRWRKVNLQGASEGSRAKSPAGKVEGLAWGSPAAVAIGKGSSLRPFEGGGEKAC